MFYDGSFWIFVSLFGLIATIIWMYRSKSFVSDDTSLGFGKGIVALLGQWIGLTVFFASTQVSYLYGVSGLIGYSLAGLSSSMGIYFFLKKLHKSRINNLSDLLLSKFGDKDGANLLNIIHWVFWLELLLYSVLASKIILQLLFGWSVIVSVIIVAVFLQLAIFFKYGRLHMASLVIVILSLASTVLIPTLVYLKVSVPTVYSGVKFLATEMLVLDQSGYWVFGIALFIRFVAHGILNSNIWSTYSQIKENRQGLCFLLSIWLWVFIPISIGSLSFVAKAQAVWPESPDEVGILVVRHFGGEIGVFLLTVSLITIIISSISFFMVEAIEKSKKALVTKACLIVIAGLITLAFPNLTFLDAMLYFGLVWAALVPILLINPNSNYSRFPSLFVFTAGLVAGVYMATHYGLQYGILSDFGISMTLMFILVLIDKARPTIKKG
jgi:hypothetical protein